MASKVVLDTSVLVALVDTRDKAVLVRTLQVAPDAPANPTRAQLIAELEALRAAGAFEHVSSLRNQYPAPSLKYVSDKQLLGAIHETPSERIEVTGSRMVA